MMCVLLNSAQRTNNYTFLEDLQDPLPTHVVLPPHRNCFSFQAHNSYLTHVKLAPAVEINPSGLIHKAE